MMKCHKQDGRVLSLRAQRRSCLVGQRDASPSDPSLRSEPALERSEGMTLLALVVKLHHQPLYARAV